MTKNTLGKSLGSLAGASLLSVSANSAFAAGDWEFSLSPLFLWGLSINAEAAIDGNVAPLDLEFKDDILENMEAVLTFHFEARRDEWTLFAEYQYVKLEPDVEISMGPLNAEAEIEFKNTMIELGAGWAFSESESTRWELIGGGRYTDQEVDVDATLSGTGPLPDQEIEIEGGDDWWHAFAGVRVFHQLSERWSFVGRGDLGYGGSDNSAANAVFFFDYRFRGWGSAFVGYRYLEYDFDNDSSSNGYSFDGYQQGPLLGLTLYW